MRKGALANVTKTLLESRIEKTQMVRLHEGVRPQNKEGGRRYAHDVDDELVEEDVAELLSRVCEQCKYSSRLAGTSLAVRSLARDTIGLTPWGVKMTAASPPAIIALETASNCCLYTP